MADVNIADILADTTNYGPAAAFDGSELFEASQAGATRAGTLNQIYDWLNTQAYTDIELTRYSETTAAASATVDRADGGKQTLTLTADVTLTVTMANGEDMELTILNGDSWAVTWPAGDWLGGSLPVLAAKTRVVIDKDSTGTLNFSLVGDYS